MTNYQIFSNLINVLLSLHEVQVVPALSVPAGQEPDIALGLGHLQPVGLAHDVTGGWLVEIGYDHLGASLLQVPQVLRNNNRNLDTEQSRDERVYQSSKSFFITII